MTIFVKKEEGLILPTKGSDRAAGYDVVAVSDPKIVGIIAKTDTHNLWSRIDYIEYETSLFIHPEDIDTHVLIHPRSSISKYNLVLANSIGLVDNDYRGRIICRFKYISQPEDMIILDTSRSISIKVNVDKIYKKGDRIAQLVISNTITTKWVPVTDLENTERGEGSFGSSGK